MNKIISAKTNILTAINAIKIVATINSDTLNDVTRNQLIIANTSLSLALKKIEILETKINNLLL